MERWVGRVALVTGASAGIGAEVCKRLAGSGMKVVGCARRLERLQEMAKVHPNLIIPYKCDIGDSNEVEAMFRWVEENPNLGGVDVCIPNAGFSTGSSLLEGSVQEWRRMMDVNVIGLNQCVQLAIKSMLRNKIDDGQIVMVGSLAGHRVVPESKRKFYAVTKAAVTSLLEGWRQEIRAMEPKNHIRVAQVSPGFVLTEFMDVVCDHDKDKADLMRSKVQSSHGFLAAADIADNIEYILKAPQQVQIHDILFEKLQFFSGISSEMQSVLQCYLTWNPHQLPVRPSPV